MRNRFHDYELLLIEVYGGETYEKVFFFSPPSGSSLPLVAPEKQFWIVLSELDLTLNMLWGLDSDVQLAALKALLYKVPVPTEFMIPQCTK